MIETFKCLNETHCHTFKGEVTEPVDEPNWRKYWTFCPTCRASAVKIEDYERVMIKCKVSIETKSKFTFTNEIIKKEMFTFPKE
jgi:hypothetical protein